MRDITNNFLKDVRKVLEENISKLGHNSADNHDSVIDGGALWALSSAFIAFHKKEYLIEATQKKDYYIEHFLDHKYGGVYNTLDANGERLDTNKVLKSQAMAIYALSEFHAATGDEEAFKAAKNIFKIIEKEFAEGDSCYISEFARDFSRKDGNDCLKGKVMLLQAYSNFYKSAPDNDLAEKIERLLDYICANIDKIEGKCSAATAWKLLDAAFILRDIDTINKVRTTAVKLIESNQITAACCTECLLSKLWMWKYCGQRLDMAEVSEAWESLKNNKYDDDSARFHVICACLGIIDII